jgi:hypothetical protein
MSLITDHFGTYCVCTPESSGLPQLPASADLDETATTQNSITWVWDAIAGATNYVLEFSTNAGFTSPTVIYSGSLLTYTRAGLSPGTTYYARVKGQASGYTDSAWITDSAATVAAPTTEVAYWGWLDADALPNEAAILAGQGTDDFPFGATIVADFTANTDPKYLWMAERSTEPTKTVWYGSALNNGAIGASETFAIKGTSASGSGASWRVYMSTFQTEQTDTTIEFRVI